MFHTVCHSCSDEQITHNPEDAEQFKSRHEEDGHDVEQLRLE